MTGPLAHLKATLRRAARAALVSALAVGPLVAGAAQAQEGTPGVLVELYTSQGCSACPPADAMMHELAGREDVIALALHVDYWDYIGWKDTFADPVYTARQKSYARAQGARHVYTPQMIIGGADVIVGAKPMKVGEHLMAHLQGQRHLDLRARRAGDVVHLSAPRPAQATRAPLVIHLVRYTAQADVAVTRGENAGRTLHHVNVVTDWQVVGDWSGAAPLDMSVPVSGPDPVVVIVQEQGPRLVLAAVRIE